MGEPKILDGLLCVGLGSILMCAWLMIFLIAFGKAHEKIY